MFQSITAEVVVIIVLLMFAVFFSALAALMAHHHAGYLKQLITSINAMHDGLDALLDSQGLLHGKRSTQGRHEDY